METSEESASKAPPLLGGDHRLIVESVGLANASIVHVVQHVLPETPEDIAKLIYQAPSELLTNLPSETAVKIAELLREAGLEMRVAGPKIDVTPGVGEFEVALVVTRVERMAALVVEVAALLGTDVDAARRLVCSSPAVLLANVSQATVDAVARRFEPLGVEVLASRVADAGYYAVVVPGAPSIQHAIARLVAERMPAVRLQSGPGTLTAPTLDRMQAEQLWELLLRTGAKVSVFNRNFERYDVQLERMVDAPASRALLERLGVPARVIGKLLTELPVVIRQNATHAETEAILEQVEQLGGRASGLPQSFQRFALTVKRVKDRASATRILRSIGDLDEREAALAVAGPSGTRVGSFTRTTARWLRELLASQGTIVDLELR